MSHIISKSFDFCYGHRVYVQKLREEFCASDDCQCKCRHNHGHQGKLTISLASMNDELNSQSMVIDFKETGWIKDLIDLYIDHKFIIDINDPMFNYYIDNLINTFDTRDAMTSQLTRMAKVEYLSVDNFNAWIVNPSVFNYANKNLTSAVIEVLEGYLIVDFVPTSEKLVEWMACVINNKMKSICTLVSAEWNETPKTSAVWSN